MFVDLGDIQATAQQVESKLFAVEAGLPPGIRNQVGDQLTAAFDLAQQEVSQIETAQQDLFNVQAGIGSASGSGSESGSGSGSMSGSGSGSASGSGSGSASGSGSGSASGSGSGSESGS